MFETMKPSDCTKENKEWNIQELRRKRRGMEFAFGMTLKLLQEEKRNLVATVFIDEDEIGWDKMRCTGVNDRLMLQTW
ncbi:hypothetical protein Tco_0513826 [Tanacetum coccineum]